MLWKHFDKMENKLDCLLYKKFSLDSNAVPVFAVWLNLTKTVSEYSIRMNTGRDALSIQNSLKDTIFGIFALKYAFYAHLIL